MQPLTKQDLRPVSELSQAFFRASNPHVSREAFASKWASALRSPLRFMRSFPQAWYIDLLDVPEEKIPPAWAICLGDAHPENFGFITFFEGPRFVFNDLDDSGEGWVAFDALRYFTALEVAGYDPAICRDLMQRYEDVIIGRREPDPFPEDLVPEIARVDRKELNKWVKDGEFNYDDPKRRLEPADADRIQTLVWALDERAGARRLEVRSVARRGRAGGGSGGLARYLVLAREPELDSLTLLEFKETTHPATSWLRALHEEDDRLARIQKNIWPNLTPMLYEEVAVGRCVYLLRQRLGRASLKLHKMKLDDGVRVLRAQVGIMGEQHRAAFHGIDASELDEWLAASTAVMVSRYRELYERLCAPQSIVQA